MLPRLRTALLLTVAAFAALGTPACATQLATHPSEPTVVQNQSEGWTRVRQPGWFSVLLPRAPEHGELETIAPGGGVLAMKELSASVDGATMAVCYAQLLDFNDHDALLASVRSTFEQQGAHVHNTQDVVVQGRDGVESFVHLPPDSRLNPSAVDAVARIRVLLDQSRAYVLIGIEPVETKNSRLAKFFDSFEFAPVQTPASAARN